MIEARTPTQADLHQWFGRPIDLRIFTLDGRAVALATYVLRNERRYLHLDVKHGGRPINVIWFFRRWLREHRERPIYAACWVDGYPKAPRLLALLGFAPTCEIQPDGKRVWVLQ